MSKLLRYTQKLFASTAGTNNIAEFGSFAASTPARYSGTTITPAIIQTLSNYLGGWFSAVVGGNAFAIEDMNALCYLYAYQLAYLMQAGVAEYDSATTYYTGSWAQSGGTVYASLQDNNTGNALTNGAFWGAFGQPGMQSAQTLPYSTTVTTGNTLQWNNLTIPSGMTLTVNSGGSFYSMGPVVVASGGFLIITGTSRIL